MFRKIFKFHNNKEVPEFNEYYPSVENMNHEQIKFYKFLKKSLDKNIHIEINGNISYLFVYLYELLKKYSRKDFNVLYNKLIYYAESYKEENKISEYCLFWAYDCLLAMNDFEGYLEKSEPKHPFGSSASQSDTRLNIQLHLGHDANIIDLILLRNGRKNEFLCEHVAVYRDFLYEANEEYIIKNGSWFTKLSNEVGNNPSKHKQALFCGSPISGGYELDIEMYSFYTAEAVIHEIKDVTREAENLLRDKLKLPRVGEGWISETRLYRYLSDHFSSTLVIQHGRPIWLGRQHYDIWFPRWNVAVEYHGKQHFEPVEFFGGEEAFKKNVERDKRKINLSRRHGVKLFVVTEDSEFNDVVLSIEKHMKKC